MTSDKEYSTELRQELLSHQSGSAFTLVEFDVQSSSSGETPNSGNAHNAHNAHNAINAINALQ